MALIDPDARVRDLYQSDGPHRYRLCAITGVTTGDTLDLSARFTKILNVYAASITSSVPASFPTINGTTLTFAQVGLANDTVLLLTIGGWV